MSIIIANHAAVRASLMSLGKDATATPHGADGAAAQPNAFSLFQDRKTPTAASADQTEPTPLSQMMQPDSLRRQLFNLTLGASTPLIVASLGKRFSELASAGAADVMRLQGNAKLIDTARTELGALADTIRNDPCLRSQCDASNRAETTHPAVDFVIAKTKQSGLYGALQQAAIQRLKDSGSYEGLISQVLEKEQAAGRTRDRAWAENWMERQFDYDCVDEDYQAGAPVFMQDHAYPEVRPMDGNTGTAVFYGDATNVRAEGGYRITITEKDNELFYTVSDFQTLKTSEPRPYDPLGTIIKGKGLRAELIGTPVPGDAFYVDSGVRVPEKHGHYVDNIGPMLMNQVGKSGRKMEVFKTLFDPIIYRNPTHAPTTTILAAMQPDVKETVMPKNS